MIGLDTNVLVRYLVQDDPTQSAIATRTIEAYRGSEIPGFVSHIALCETVWVLESRYQQSREQVADTLEKLLKTVQLRFEDLQLTWRAFNDYKDGNVDFADALMAHYHIKHGCTTTLTFDKKAAKLEGFTLLQ